ncbi:MAG: NAD(P)-dependent alcohol dehydrogenase [Streptosporangiaceae bacterium]
MTTEQASMRAIIQHGYGTPRDVLRPGQVQRPLVGPNDVLIRVRATSVNTPDWATVAGVPAILRLGAGLRRPRHPVRGSDVAGVVEAVGQQVTDFRPGDEVFGSVWGRTARTKLGTFAEYAVAPASQVVRKPSAVSFEDAAASVMSGLTALMAMRDVGQVDTGRRVLINGASGGVGTMAVQIAASMGAEVTGVCGSGNVELVRSLGAARVIDYTTEDFTRDRQRYDVILDNVLNQPPSATARLLGPRGVLIPNSLGITGGLFAGLPRMARAMLMGLGSTTVKTVTLGVNHENLNALASLIESGQVRVIVEKTYPFEHTASAVAHMLGHHARGQIAITVP